MRPECELCVHALHVDVVWKDRHASALIRSHAKVDCNFVVDCSLDGDGGDVEKFIGPKGELRGVEENILWVVLIHGNCVRK
jgi:hypothetical protein